jgi:ParB family chromosome partitioning protein
MSDEDLVVAQGQENSARTDLSYIERGRFALALSDWGFDRSVIMSALNMEKTQLSRLIAIAKAVPREIAEAIGPAPKAGRPRWASFVELLEQAKSKATLKRLFATEQFTAVDSDTRFNLTLDALTPKAEKNQKSDWRDDDGSKVATVIRANAKLSVVIDTKKFPEFGEFIAGQLPELYRAFKAQKE